MAYKKFTWLSLALIACSCAHDGSKKPTPETRSFSKYKGGQDRVELMSRRLDKGPLKEFEVAEYFLAAESLVQTRRIEPAIKFYKAVYEVEPSLVTGMKLARLLSMTGKIEDTELIVRKMALLYPKSAEPLIALSYLAQVKGNKAEAEEILARAYAKHPSDEEVSTRYVEFLIEENKKQKANEILLAGLKKNPSSSFILLRLAKISSEEKKYAEAKNYLDTLLRESPESIEGWTLAGFIAEEEKNYAAAEKYFREAYDKDPQNDTLARYYTSQLLRQNKLQEARRMLLRLEAGNEKEFDLDLTFQLAVVQIQLEDYAEAKVRLTRLLEKSPEKGKIYFLLGQCEEMLKKDESAISFYEKVESENESFVSAQQRLVFLNIDNNKIDKARTLLSHYSDKLITGERSYRFLGNAYARLNDYKVALKFVEAGLVKHPKSPDLGYLSAAYKEFVVGRDASIAALEKFVVQNPKFSPALNHLGYTLADNNLKPKEAIALLQRAVAEEPKNGFYLDSLGWAFFKAKNFADSEKTLLAALQLEPEEPIILEHMGELKMAQGNQPIALRYFEQAIELFKKKPEWRLKGDGEWKSSYERVNKRVQELRRLALPTEMIREERLK